MTKSLHIGSLSVRLDLDRPRVRRGKPWVDKVQIELHDDALQIWSETLCGEHFVYDADQSRGRMFQYVGELPDLDVIHRYLAEQKVAHGSDMIGDYLTAPVEAMEKAIAARDGSSVYFADAGGQIKIGWSRKVSARLAQLQTGSAVPIKLLATTPGGLALERRLHKQFHHLRLSGEWFLAAPELLDHVASLTREVTP